jgi:glycerol-3-phosphate dehydrogenase
MQREPTKLADREFDVLVVGAGINGACVARDAALRGLSVAVVDRSDFGSATSFNSLRIVHGGLRYLQHLDFRRMRESICERSAWLRIAPHLVHRLPCVAATSGMGARSRLAFRAAFLINDAIGWDRNRGVQPSRQLLPGRLLSRSEMLDVYPGSDVDTLTGGALWYDGQMFHSERLLLALLQDAVGAGAVVCNYVDVAKAIVAGSRVVGVTARDTMSGDSFDIRARMVVNTAGPHVERLMRDALGEFKQAPRIALSKAMNLLTRRIGPDQAVGVPSRYRDPNAVVDHGTRLLFVTPWRDLTMTGTTHFPYDGDPDHFAITESEVSGFVDEINAACPDARLNLDDVRFAYGGLLPAAKAKAGDHAVRLLQHHRILDHKSLDSVGGLISLVGVKYTTARLAAEQVVNLVLRKLQQTGSPCVTAEKPVFGADCADIEVLEHDALATWSGRIPTDSVRSLVRLYGTQLECVLAYCKTPENEPMSDEDVTACTVRYAVHRESACRLSDVVLRRTDLGSCGVPSEAALEHAATIMADESGWTAQRGSEELDAVRLVFRRWGVAETQPEAIAERKLV